jgi:hypothetical protein
MVKLRMLINEYLTCLKKFYNLEQVYYSAGYPIILSTKLTARAFLTAGS